MYSLLKNYTLADAIKIEIEDRQFLAYKKLFDNKFFSDKDYLFLILQNALISYQLSWKWEDYHEEFVDWVLKNNNFEKLDFYDLFKNFLWECKNNRRFFKVKLDRIAKSLDFYYNFETKFYYEDMDKLSQDLWKIMKQSKEAKTVVFAVKIFSYWARNVFWYLNYFPSSLMIPIDSRLENLYKFFIWKEKYTKKEIKNFYIDLSNKLNIPLLHLDSILWVNYEKILDSLKSQK